MKVFLTTVVLLFVSHMVLSDELEQAYQKEYAYLVAEKEALKARLDSIKSSHKQNINKLRGDVDQLQGVYLGKQNSVDQLNRNLAEASRNDDFNSNDQLLLETTVIQALDSINKNDLSVDETQDLIDQLSAAVDHALTIMSQDQSTKVSKGDFFDANGQLKKGDILQVGRVASYALNELDGGALSPAGNGKFKVWDQKTLTTSKSLQANPSSLENIDVFLYEDSSKPIEKKEEKTFGAEVKAGGFVGKIILLLGIIGFILVLMRVFVLKQFSTNIQKLTNKISQKMSAGDKKAALEICKNDKNSASNVIAATLRNLDKDRDHIEDIVSESILHESSKIDLFGSFIIVIAAVSPLLGLLGTVTGMIGTFDIITEFGTGDPKLLSSGISEALITTKFGLVVAIPLLLFGNLLSSWGTRIKNDIEQSALHIINAYK